MLKNVLKIVSLFVVGMVGGIFAEQIFWPYFIERPLFYQYQLEQRPIYLTEKKETIIQENTALKGAIEKVERAVFGVRTKTKTGKILEGSGLIITSDGLAVTLAELVPLGGETTFFLEEQTPSYQVLKRDPKENLVLIKFNQSNLPTVGFADFERIRLGERVFLLGVILEKGLISGVPPAIIKKKVNEGIITSFDEKALQTNIFEKTNLSGSPLFNIEVGLLGLNTIDTEGRIVSIPVKKIKEFAGF